MVRGLKQELQLTSNSDFLSDALALFRWAVWERKRGHRIFSETETGARKELVLPRLERVAPEIMLPRVEISWTPRELDRKSTRLNSSHTVISYAVFCLKKKNINTRSP